MSDLRFQKNEVRQRCRKHDQTHAFAKDRYEQTRGTDKENQIDALCDSARDDVLVFTAGECLGNIEGLSARV